MPSPDHIEGHHPPFGTVSVHSNTSVRGHCMQVQCAHGTDAQSPVAYSSGADYDL